MNRLLFRGGSYALRMESEGVRPKILVCNRAVSGGITYSVQNMFKTSEAARLANLRFHLERLQEKTRRFVYTRKDSELAERAKPYLAWHITSSKSARLPI